MGSIPSTKNAATAADESVRLLLQPMNLDQPVRDLRAVGERL